jgi:hypothetical protein
VLFAYNGNIRHHRLGRQAVQGACTRLTVNCVAVARAQTGLE